MTFVEYASITFGPILKRFILVQMTEHSEKCFWKDRRMKQNRKMYMFIIEITNRASEWGREKSKYVPNETCSCDIGGNFDKCFDSRMAPERENKVQWMLWSITGATREAIQIRGDIGDLFSWKDGPLQDLVFKGMQATRREGVTV